MNRKGYSEGLKEKNSELAGIEDDFPMNSGVCTPTTANNTPTAKPKKSIAKDPSKATPKPAAKESGARVAEKSKAAAAGNSVTSSKVQKKALTDDVKTSKSSEGAAEGKEKSSSVENKAVDKAGSILVQKKVGENNDRLIRWLKMEQKLVEIDIAVKSSLHIDKPSPDRCITALNQLNELPIVPFMLKKQPDIVTTIHRIRNYIGPIGFSSWADKEAKKKMEKNIDIIQKKAEKLYNKFKSYFAYQGKKPFIVMFKQELDHFKHVTKDLNEQEVLCMMVDPTK